MIIIPTNKYKSEREQLENIAKITQTSSDKLGCEQTACLQSQCLINQLHFIFLKFSYH